MLSDFWELMEPIVGTRFQSWLWHTKLHSEFSKRNRLIPDRDGAAALLPRQSIEQGEKEKIFIARDTIIEETRQGPHIDPG